MTETPAPGYSISLRVKGGGLVAKAFIPEFALLPEVVVWGTRMFQHRGPDPDMGGGAILYREVFAYHIVNLPPYGVA